METGRLTQSMEIKKEAVAAYAKCWIIFILILIVSMVIVKLFVGIEDVERIFKQVFSGGETSSSTEAADSIFDYWVHNGVVNLIYIILGFIPFLYIPIIGMCANSALQGALCAFLSIAVNKGLLVCFLYGYGVHGIIENLANVLGYTLGFLICRNITRIIKEKSGIRSIAGKLKCYAVIYCCVIIPLLLVAAVLEAKVTPFVIDGLLKVA